MKECIKGNEYNPDIYRSDTNVWQDGEYTVYRSTQWTAPGCHDGCGLLYYVKDGKVEKVEGDPNNGFNCGTLCMRCLALTEAMYAPDRVKYPMKRSKADRGKDAWERISWEEAYGMIKDRVDDIQERYGHHGPIVVTIGTGRNYIWQTPWLAYAAFQTPNLVGGFLSGSSCYAPRGSILATMTGDYLLADLSQARPDRFDDPEYVVPECVLLWGNNPIVSNGDGFLGHWVVEAMKRGSELVVVDPRLTWMAAKAKYWLPLRPATDAPLAMAMNNVIISEDLYDHDFVENYCYGFEEYAAACAEWTPEKAAEVCWLDAEDIRAAARFVASAKPMAVQWGLAIDQQISGTPASQAVVGLSAITDNIDVPGGQLLMPGHAFNLPLDPGGALAQLNEEDAKNRMGVNTYPIRNVGMASMGMDDMLLEVLESDGERGDVPGKYPVEMLVVPGNNFISCMGAESPRVMEGCLKSPFNVIIDVSMTPTAMAIGDLFLPCAMSAERESIRAWWWPLRTITKVANDYYEAKSDEQIVLDLINLLNPEGAPGKTVEEWLDKLLLGSDYGKSYKDLQKEVIAWPEWHYRKHEKGLNRDDGGLGFRTMHGRFNLKCDYLEQCGLNPLPFYDEPEESPYSTPDLYEEYPIILMTGRRSWEFFHSEHRNMPTMREFHPEPIFEISPELAAEYGIEEGDWCWIENHRGRCKERAHITPGLDPKMIEAEHAWWFPEESRKDLYRNFDSNINNLTTMSAPGKSGYGAPYSGLLCKIYKCTPENSEVSPNEQVLERGGWNYERKHLPR